MEKKIAESDRAEREVGLEKLGLGVLRVEELKLGQKRLGGLETTELWQVVS